MYTQNSKKIEAHKFSRFWPFLPYVIPNFYTDAIVWSSQMPLTGIGTMHTRKKDHPRPKEKFDHTTASTVDRTDAFHAAAGSEHSFVVWDHVCR